MDSNKQSQPTFNHETVLLRETIDALEVTPHGTYIDCTFGGGGHARYLLSQLDDRGHLFGFDQDAYAIKHAMENFVDEIDQGRLTMVHRNFREIASEMHDRHIEYVDGIYYDLGVSSPQFDETERGFSYKLPARLDMRMNQAQALSAYEVVNEWPYEELVRIIHRYGEERFAKRIARAIELHRQAQPIETTVELAEIVKEAIPAATRRSGGHPAKRTFQAIRIAVNDELGVLEESLRQGAEMLSIGGRMAVISFHSLEDRIVKQFFRELTEVPQTPPNLPIIPDAMMPDYRLVSRKPISVSEDEIERNFRARSAKLRVIKRVK